MAASGSFEDNQTDSWDPTQYEADVRPADVDGAAEGVAARTNLRTAVIRTSDRMMYRRCRRRWGWNSHLRQNMGPKEHASPLWFGSGFHFALEDYHGAKRFSSAVAAFEAYTAATKKRGNMILPADLDELVELGRGMLEYYESQWLVARDPLTTYVHNGVPQVEVNFRVDIPFDATHYGYDRVVYSGTLDRVAIDEDGQIWIVEYKTAKQMQTMHFANDSQVSSYCWAGNLLYGQPIAGVIYQQHRKDVPKEPRYLANGRISTDKRQLITHRSLRQHLINVYGTVLNAPKDQVDFLNWLVNQESLEADKFIRRDKVYRNFHQAEAEGVKILMEVEEMLNPELALYPNPDRTCAFMCPFNGACVSIDDGSDWEHELGILMQPREPQYDSWRKFVVWPDAPNPENPFGVVSDLVEHSASNDWKSLMKE